MDKQYKKVYVADNYIPNRANEGEVEISAEYVYLTIPKEYVCTYQRLLVYLADFGEAAIKDCQAACKGHNLYIIQCWNMFQSALACYTLGLLDKADLYIKYINAQLENLYKNSEKELYCGGACLPISEDGELKARVSCDNAEQARFYVDKDTETAYNEYIGEKERGAVYTEDTEPMKFDE